MRRLLPILILVLGALALYVDFWPGKGGIGTGARFFLLSDINSGLGQTPQTRLGLDISGGFEITYQVVDGNRNPVNPGSDQLSVIRGIVEQRVNSTGVSEPTVQTLGSNQILIQVPNASNKEEIEKLVGTTGQLEFVLLPPDQYGTNTQTTCPTQPNQLCKTAAAGSQIDPTLPAQFLGSQLDPTQLSAAVNTEPGQQGKWLVKFAFKGDAAPSFATWTGQHVNDYFAIVLDGTVQSAPFIQTEISKGQGQITGNFTQAEAKSLATVLQYGALPYPLAEIDNNNVPATLGATFLMRTLLAGAIGIGLVALFMLIFYRLPGLVAVLALSYYGVAVLAIFRIIPVTLTLAGIAGFVLSVGMAVDANILIFERTKEELRTGKTLATAVEAGFNRAWNSILDSNVSSLITASILYFLGSATIKGFALVLIIGVATSMFTAITVSRTLLRVIVQQGFVQKAWLWGVTDEEFQARAAVRSSRREARARV